MQKSLFKNTIYKSILSFASIVIPLLVGPYIARLLDVELYGIYNKIYAEFQIFLVFASFGIYTFGVREISKIRDDKVKVAQLFSNLFLISILSNLIILIIYLIFAFITSTSNISLIIYIIFTIQFLGNMVYIEFVNEALENFKFITIKTIIVKLLYLVAIFVFIRKSSDIISYAIVVSLVVFLNNFISFIYAKRKLGFDFSNIKIKKYLLPLFVILIISNTDLLYGQLDKVLLGRTIGGVAVTLYYIPYYLIATITTIAYSVINVSIPRLSYVLVNEGKQRYEEVLKKSISALLFLILPLCFGVLVLANEVMVIYSGQNYLSAVPILILACVERVIISCQSVMTNLVMYPNNQENKILKYNLVFGIVNIILNVILIISGKFTVFTAMLTTCISILLVTIVSYKYAISKLDVKVSFFTKQNLMYLILCLCFIPISLIIKFIDFGFYINTLLIIVICIALYFVVLYLKKDENLFTIINKFLNKFKRVRSSE